MNITVDVDARTLEAAVRRAPVVVLGELNNWVRKTAMRGERRMKEEAQDSVDTGRLQSSIHSTIGHLQGSVRPTAKHAPFVHDGRRPGKMPPFREGTSLNSWARRRGIPPFLVARAIARRGTKPNKFVDRTYTAIKPIAEREAKETLSDIVRKI